MRLACGIGSYCNFNGFIPGQKIASYANLESLNLRATGLSRTIPPVLGTISTLTSLILGNNALDGSIPLPVARLPYLQYLDLSDNQLTSAIPTFEGNNGNGEVLEFLDLVSRDPSFLEGSPLCLLTNIVGASRVTILALLEIL